MTDHTVRDCQLCGHTHQLHETCVHPLAGSRRYAEAVAAKLDHDVPITINTEGAS